MKYNFESLYEHIGYLLYAAVLRDSRLSARELVKLNAHIDQHWAAGSPGDSVLLSKHLADAIDSGVRYASVNEMSSDHALLAFRTYFLNHASDFEGALRERILLSLATILKAFPESPYAGDVEAASRNLFTTPAIRA